jgi:CRISPR/Cas system-associated endoribonuclease Cas2
VQEGLFAGELTETELLDRLLRRQQALEDELLLRIEAISRAPVRCVPSCETIDLVAWIDAHA